METKCLIDERSEGEIWYMTKMSMFASCDHVLRLWRMLLGKRSGADSGVFVRFRTKDSQSILLQMWAPLCNENGRSLFNPCSVQHTACLNRVGDDACDAGGRKCLSVCTRRQTWIAMLCLMPEAGSGGTTSRSCHCHFKAELFQDELILRYFHSTSASGKQWQSHAIYSDGERKPFCNARLRLRGSASELETVYKSKVVY